MLDRAVAEPILQRPRIMPALRGLAAMSQFDPGCVKTLRGITAPGILGYTVTLRAKKRKNLSSARHYDQIRFRFHTAKTQGRHPDFMPSDSKGAGD